MSDLGAYTEQRSPVIGKIEIKYCSQLKRGGYDEILNA